MSPKGADVHLHHHIPPSPQQHHQHHLDSLLERSHPPPPHAHHHHHHQAQLLSPQSSHHHHHQQQQQQQQQLPPSPRALSHSPYILHSPQFTYAPPPSSLSPSQSSRAVASPTAASSAPVSSTAGSSTGLSPRFSAPLPALHDHTPRYDASSSSSGAYEASSVTSNTSPYHAGFLSGYQPAFSPAPTSSSFSSSLTVTDRRPRIPSIHSPKPMMAPHNRSTSGGTKSVSPTLGSSSVRSEYATSTPGLSRHMASRPSQGGMLQPPPHSPISPASMGGGLGSPGHDAANGLSVGNTASTTIQSPPLGETQLLHHLSSADGHMVRPEIHARVDKGFFLADRDWTCYRRNYFSVICSYTLSPANHSLPLFLRRSTNSAPEHILAFAMCISAVVDSVGGKTVELVQHTPKRDKGPQHTPQKIKLSPGGMGFGGGGAAAGGMQQQSQPGLDNEYQYGAPQPQQHQQHIAVFDRIQFKSATANNGKRRAAQQYYHLLVELFADVGAGSAAQQPQQPGAPPSDGWVKIAYKMSAPMVVRGRSPGHYADGQRAGNASSPGGGNTGGNAQQGGAHPAQHPSGPTYTMDPSGSLGASNPGGPGAMGHHQHQHGVPSPTVSAAHPQSAHSGSPASHYTDPAIDPELNAEQPPITGVYPQPAYTMVPTYYEPSPVSSSSHVENGYSTQPQQQQQQQNSANPSSPHASHTNQSHPSQPQSRKSEHPLDTSVPEYDSGDVNSYAPPGLGDRYSKPVVKDEYAGQSLPWLGSGARQQGQYPNVMYPKCGTRFETVESSKGVFPDISPL